MKDIIVHDCQKAYYPSPPYHPPQKYPEYQFADVNPANFVYEEVRNSFRELGLDEKNFNKASWNPLGEIISEGDFVLVKPSFVAHRHPSLGEAGMNAVITHPSITRALIDYVFIALRGKGKIVIGDAPIQGTDFEALKLFSIDSITSFYEEKDVGIEVVDFRKELGITDRRGTVVKRVPLGGDPLGYTIVDLGQNSELREMCYAYRLFRVTQYDKKIMERHHNDCQNAYLIPSSALRSDVIMNLPKLKTHAKAGMTCALKNMVGLSGSKDWLPHHRFGSVEEGGDEYLHKSLRKKWMTILTEKIDVCNNKLKRNILYLLRDAIKTTRKIYDYKDPYSEGSWWGNDTLPRTIVDLNKIIMYADKEGKIRKTQQRRIFTLVDAVIAGERKGPLEPHPKDCGLLIAGLNPVTVDIVCSKILGFDYRKIPTIMRALRSISPLPENFIGDLLKDVTSQHFEPAPGWVGQIELK